MKKKIIVTLAVLALLINSILVYGAEIEYEDVEAAVVKNEGVREENTEDGVVKKIQSMQVRILEGEYENEEYGMEYILSSGEESVATKVELKEDDKVLVSIEHKEGEIVNVSYIRTINNNYLLYIILAGLIVLVIIIGRTNVIKPLIVYLFSIILICFICILSVQNNWNLILTSSIISLIITISVAIKVNGITKKTITMIICSIVGCGISGIIMYALYDILKLNNINIKMGEGLINIKEMLCAITILFGGILANIVILSSFNMFTFLNRPYKTKSDNIIGGQRSLKI